MSIAAGLGQALGLGLEKGVKTGLQSVLTNFKKQTQRQEDIDKLNAQEKKKFLGNIEKDINSSLKFQQLDPDTDVSVDDKSQFKKDSIEEFIKTGDPNAVSSVIERFNQERLQKKAEEAPTSLAGRIFGGGDPTQQVQQVQPTQQIQPDIQPQEEVIPGIPRGKKGPRKGGPNIVDLFKEEGLIPEERTEIAGVPIEQIPSHLLPFLAQTEAFRTAEARKPISDTGKSLIAGSTLGLSENIPGFKRDKPTTKLGKVNDVLARLFGGFQTVGALEKYAIQPIGSKIGLEVAARAQSGKILKGLATQIATKAVVRGTGSAGINFVNQFIQNEEPVNLKDVAKNGLAVASIGAAFDILQDAAIPLIKSLNNLARKSGRTKWDTYKEFASAVKNRGFSFSKGKPQANTATPNKILEIGNDFTSVRALPNLVQENIQSKSKEFKTKPEDIASTARTKAQEAGIDIDAVEQGDPQSVQGFNRVVTDLSKEDIITPIDREAFIKPGSFTDPELTQTTKNAIGTKENADLLETEFTEKAFTAIEEIKAQGGQNKASSISLLKRKDAVDAIKFIRKIKKDLPFEKEIAKKELKPSIQKVQKVAEEAPKPEITKEALKEREKETRGLARKAAKSPVEAFSESVPAKEKPTEAQIFDQITTSFDRIKTEIRKPEIVDIKKVERRAELDKRAIDKANDILKRGELLSNVEQDTFLKIKKQYADAYKDMIDFNKEIIEDNKGSEKARLIRIAREAEKMNNELSNILKRINADIVLQENKRAIQKLSKGAKGSFFRNQLKKLRSDIDSLQENIFKQNKLKSQLELKTERVVKEAKETLKLFNDLMKNPTSEKAQKVADAAGIDNTEVKNEAKKFVNEAVDEELTKEEIKEKLEEISKKTEEKAEEEKETKEKEKKKTKERKKEKTEEKETKEKEKTEEKAEEEKETKEKEKTEKERKKSIHNGLLFTAIKIFLREKFGFNLPTRGAARFLGKGATLVVAVSSSIVAGIKQAIKLNRINKFKRAKGNTNRIEDITIKLRKKGFSTAQIKNLKKKAGL